MDSPTQNSQAASKWLPLVVVLVIPLATGLWWWSAQRSKVVTDAAAENEEDKKSLDKDAQPTPKVPLADPYLETRQTIRPLGHVEAVHQTEEFTYLFVHSTDADRWLVTPTVDFKVGDIVQYEIAPLSIKENFRAKGLGRIFPKIVLVGAGGVSLIEPGENSKTNPAEISTHKE